jgi:hypothetical protein
MAILDNAVAGAVESVTGLPPLGVGLAAVAAGVVGVRAARPIIKATLRAYFALTIGSRRWAAEAREQIDDLYAEAQHDYAASHPRPTGTADLPRMQAPRSAVGAATDEVVTDSLGRTSVIYASARP